MNKNILLVIGAVVIVGMGMFLVLGGSNDSDKPNTSGSAVSEAEQKSKAELANQAAEPAIDESGVTIISYTNDGFVPEDQTVAIGATVRFVNNSSVSMWVASDDHPTHKELPEFDNKQGVGPGETYEFTFEEAGKWKYHDHLNPNAEGTISVTGL